MRLYRNGGRAMRIDGRAVRCELCPCNWGVYTGKSFQVVPFASFDYVIFLSADGTKLYASSWRAAIRQYALASAWDISTAEFVKGSQAFGANTPAGLYISPDGTQLYLTDGYYRRLYWYTLPAAWDIDTPAGNIFIALGYTPGCLYFSPDGTRLYVINSDNDRIIQYTLATAWDISAMTQTAELAGIGDPVGVYFSPDGTKLYLRLSGPQRIDQYALAAAWDISTAAYNSSSIRLLVDGHSLYIDPSGRRMYIIGDNPDNTVYQYDIPEWPLPAPSAPAAARLMSAAPASPGTSCRYAEDTGEKAFPNLPCRGNRIVCHKIDGHVSYARACRPGKCKFYEEDTGTAEPG